MKPALFVAYSRKDQQWYDVFTSFLNQFVHSGDVIVWHDRQIGPGEVWERTIREFVLKCDIALLLVSRDFLATEFIAREELPILLKRSEEASVVLIPILLNRAATPLYGLNNLQFANNVEKPLSELEGAELQKELNKIAEKLYGLLTLEQTPVEIGKALAEKVAVLSKVRKEQKIPSGNFAATLREFIEAPANGLLLNADQVYSQIHGRTRPSQAVFELTSGRFVKQFVTIWELFDHREMFQSVLKALTERAADIYATIRFAKIATSTSTGRELGIHLLAALADRGIKIHHVHWDTTRGNEVLPDTDYKDTGDLVLLLTDVVATGNLVLRLVQSIERAGGAVVAILAVVLTDPDYIGAAVGRSTFILKDPIDQPSSTGSEVHFLTTYPIEPESHPPMDADFRIRIDYETVLPKSLRLGLREMFKPAFSGLEAFQMLDIANCLSSGFFQMPSSLVTTVCDFRTLISHHGRERIWPAIRERLPSKSDSPLTAQNTVLLSSYNKEDLAFKFALEDWFREYEKAEFPSLTLKRESRDSALLFSTLHPHGSSLEDKHILIASATNASSEKLRSIVGLLANCRVRSITFICLFSRSRPYASEFIARVSELLGSGGNLRLENAQDDGPLEARVAFNVITVFSIQDIESDRLRDGLGRMVNIIRQHRFNVRTAQVRRLSRAYEEELTGTSISDATRRPYDLESNDVDRRFKSVSAALGWLVNDYAEHREPDTWVQLIGKTDNHRILQFICVVLISEAELFRINGTIRSALSIAVSRLKAERDLRFTHEGKLEVRSIEELDRLPAIEITEAANYIAKRVKIEKELYFFIALLVATDPDAASNIRIQELAHSECSFETWKRHPLNIKVFFEDEEMIGALSFLLDVSRYTQHRPGEGLDQSGGLREFLEKMRGHCRVAFEGYRSLDGPTNVVLCGNCNVLLDEIGALPLQSRAAIIRFLHSSFMNPDGRAAKAVSRLEDELSFLGRAFDAEDAIHEKARRPLDPELLLCVERCRSAIAVLSDAMVQGRTCALFSIHAHHDNLRYVNSADEPGTLHDLATMDRLLLRSSKAGGMTYLEFRIISGTITRILNDLNAPETGFVSLIARYSVPLSRCILEEAIWADKEMRAGFTFWENAFLQSESLQTINSARVLVDEFELRSTLRNVMSNARHVEQSNTKENVQAYKIDVSPQKIHVSSDSEPVDGWQLRLRAPCDVDEIQELFAPKSSLAIQRARLRAFEGEMQVERKQSDEALFTISLISRSQHLTQQ